MKYSNLLVVLCAGFALAGSAVEAGAAQKGVTHASAAKKMTQKVVFQVSDNDPRKWQLTLNNMKNLHAAMPDATIELVAYGPGIAMLDESSPVGEGVKAALAGGVTVAACENTMKALKLEKTDLLAGVSFVPAGVVELVQRQAEGYAYIRP